MRNAKWLCALVLGLTAIVPLASANAESIAEPKAATSPGDAFANLKFRNLGPAVAGGRVTAVVGIPGNPEIYYVGAAAGGVFKTTQVLPDPDLQIPPDNFVAQTRAALEVRNELSALNEMINRIDAMQKQLKDFQEIVQASRDPKLETRHAPVLAEAKALESKLQSIKQSVYNTSQQHNVEEDDIHSLDDFHAKLSNLASNVNDPYGQPPNQLARQQLSSISAQLEQHLNEFNALVRSNVGAYNKAAQAAGAPTVFAPGPVEVKAIPSSTEKQRAGF